MRNALIRQAQFVPLTAMLIAMVAALFVPHYSSMTQHMSELGIIDHPAASIMPIAAVVAGGSVAMFGVGLWLHPSGAFGITAFVAALTGIALASGGIFPTGTAMHGLYGLTMFYVLVPACFAAEVPAEYRTRLLTKILLAAAVLSMVYMWGLLMGLEPHGIRGLTQRLAILVIYGWYAIAGYMLLRGNASAPGKAAGAQTVSQAG